MSEKNLDEMLSYPNLVYLTVYLLEEKDKGPSSLFSEYIGILPTNFEQFPVFFTEKEKALLKGTQLLNMIE